MLQDYSLLYFNIEVVSHDITIRLNYLGDFTADKPLNVPLLSYEKQSSKLKVNLLMTRKGIYQFEFDNSYSWINNKTIKVEKAVLMPLEFSSPNTPSWIPSFYENVPLNHQPDKSKVISIARKEASPEKALARDPLQGTGNITKAGRYYNLKVRRNGSVY